jgi:hypothetical protein
MVANAAGASLMPAGEPHTMISEAMIPQLRSLIDELVLWDEAAHELEAHARTAPVPPSVRTHMRKELERLHPRLHMPRGAKRAPLGLRGRLRRWLSRADVSTSASRLRRREQALLARYERLCERSLPFSLSALLLRHHDALRAASTVGGPIAWRPRRHAAAPDRSTTRGVVHP